MEDSYFDSKKSNKDYGDVTFMHPDYYKLKEKKSMSNKISEESLSGVKIPKPRAVNLPNPSSWT